MDSINIKSNECLRSKQTESSFGSAQRSRRYLFSFSVFIFSLPPCPSLGCAADVCTANPIKRMQMEGAVIRDFAEESGKMYSQFQ